MMEDFGPDDVIFTGQSGIPLKEEAMRGEASEDLTFLDLTLMRQFKGVVKGRSGPVIYVHSPGSPSVIGGHVEAVVPRGPLRGLIRATVLDHQESKLSMWVTSCELTGFQTREARYRTPGQDCTIRYGKNQYEATRWSRRNRADDWGHRYRQCSRPDSPRRCPSNCCLTSCCY